MHVKLGEFGRKLIVLLLGFGMYANPVWSEEVSDGAEMGKLPANVDLRPLFEKWGLERRQQGGRPTCSVFTVVGALEFALAKSRPPGERLSVEFLNWAANQGTRGQRDGGFFSELWDGFAAYGICNEQRMPYRAEFDASQNPDADTLAEAKSRLALGLKLRWIKQWNVNTGLADTEFLAIKHTLNQGWPVCGGFRWPKQETWKDEVLQMCPPESVFDGHSVLLVGYRDEPGQPGGGVFIFKNTSHGGHDGFMPYAYARDYMNDAAWIAPEGAAKPDGARAAAKPCIPVQ